MVARRHRRRQPPRSRRPRRRRTSSSTQFLAGLRKLFDADDNWTFLQPLMLRMEHCAKCQTCAEACQIYDGERRQDDLPADLPLRGPAPHLNKYVKPGGACGRFTAATSTSTGQTVARLAELAYRCTLCRRCAQTCPIGVDNGLITREIRKVFSQEMGIAPTELHEDGSVQQLKTGSSTGMNPPAVPGQRRVHDEDDIEEKTGMRVQVAHGQGRAPTSCSSTTPASSWPGPRTPRPSPSSSRRRASTGRSRASCWATTPSTTASGTTTCSSRASPSSTPQVAKKLGVKKIVIGECGHAHKALTVIADRILHRRATTSRAKAACTLLARHRRERQAQARSRRATTSRSRCTTRATWCA